MLFGLFLAFIALCAMIFIFVPHYTSRYFKKKKINNAEKKIKFFESKFHYLIGDMQINQISDDTFVNIICDNIKKGDFDLDPSLEISKREDRINFINEQNSNTLPVKSIYCELPVNNANDRKKFGMSNSELPDKHWEISIYFDYEVLFGNFSGSVMFYSIKDNELEIQKEYLDYLEKQS